MTKEILILIFCVICANYGVTGITIKDRKQCCDLGTNFAKSGNDCGNFKPEWAGPRLRNEKACLNTVDMCCKKQIRQKDCQLGTIDAVNGVSCAVADGVRKDCCEACQAGIDASRAKDPCTGLGLGAPYDDAFNQCCEDYSKVTSSTASTLSTSTTTTTKSFIDNFDTDSESIENICDSDVCAQKCEPVGDSFKCDCFKGFILMEDGVSCKPEKRVLKKGGRCELFNPCDHDCTDTGTAIKCSCREGYQLSEDNRTCKDIDECALNIHDCTSIDDCINEIGSYSCYDPILDNETIEYENKCPNGYQYNFEKQLCDDIDECQIKLICLPPKVCKNTIGSYTCEVEEDTPLCPPGFHYKAATEACADIDECLTGENDCNKESQFCLNTKGNYTCVDKASRNTCPPGFKMNTVVQQCEDINECEEEENLCAQNEKCVNEPGGHTCVPQDNSGSIPTSKVIPTTRSTTTTSTTQPTTTTQKVICPTGYSYVQETHLCADINECQVGLHNCKVAERCDNTIGSFHCSRIFGCGTGYTLNSANGLCEDDDECILGTHNCRELGPNFKCRNTFGSYRCEPTRPYYQNPSPLDKMRPLAPYQPNIPPSTNPTTAQYSKSTLNAAAHTPDDKNPIYELPFISSKYYTVQTTPSTKATEQSKPSYAQDPRVVPGSITPLDRPRSNITQNSGTIFPIGRFTTLSTSTVNTPRSTYPSPKIFTANTEDDGTLPYYSPRLTSPKTTPSTTTTTVTYGYPNWPTRENPYYPIISGQQKKCLPGYRMNYRGQCEDIDECESNPCGRFEKCINYKGRYDCIPPIQCKLGYELNESGDQCIDVNECARGIHKCLSTQICKNYVGYYTCECPPGHHLDKITNQCEDLDECKMFRPCRVSSSTCINLKGSFRCDCKEGFQRKSPSECEDINECVRDPRLCEHNCVNIWGSYRCSCNQGFTLNTDNRTCTDIDECERFKDRRLCIGSCKNVPGSYRCECPPGYKLGSDGRVCIDIDECQQNVCLSEEVCLNTRGAFKCYSIKCPANYIKDTEHKSRCKRIQSFCDPRDYECLLMPEQYTYQYITLVSNLPLTHGHINLFRIKGPEWYASRAEFTLKLLDVICPNNIEQVNDMYFKKVNDQFNSMVLYLVKPIAGPQEIKLQIEMRLFQGNIIIGNVVVYIIIVVSEFPF
ncbi:uncharacterized protein [Diabrotica undecimpunctata]|uniref:uncharacterized protein n=1 Tax=Diabrotica undecimpunctata TaxID=50387 RepID=UPI003B63318E